MVRKMIQVIFIAGWPAKIAACLGGLWAKADDYFGKIFLWFVSFHLGKEMNENK